MIGDSENFERMRAEIRAQVARYTPEQAAERRAALKIEEPDAMARLHEVDAEVAKRCNAKSLEERLERDEQAFRERLERAYQDPAEAFDRWRDQVDRSGVKPAAADLRERPESFGELQSDKVPSWRGSLGLKEKESTERAAGDAAAARSAGETYEETRATAAKPDRTAHDPEKLSETFTRQVAARNAVIRLREERKALAEYRDGGEHDGHGFGLKKDPPRPTLGGGWSR